MAKASALERLVRLGLVAVLAGLAAAAIYLWLFRSPDESHTFDNIYQASVAQADGSFTLAAALGVPMHADKSAAKYNFYSKDGHRHVRFQFPLEGPRRSAVIVGEAVRLGGKWLVVRLVATFPGHVTQINLSPNIPT